MATLKYRLNRKNSSGGYDTIHYETSSNIVMRSNGESVEVALARADSHENSRSNPHGITPSQIGALPSEPQFIEMKFSTPFIDFHFNNSDADYTSRIIEDQQSSLNVNNVRCNSDKNVAVAQARNIRAQTSDPGAGSSLTTGEILLIYE